MANLRTAMDAAFWDLDIASPRNLDGCAKAVPGESFPLDGARAGRALRVQQLSFIGSGFPLGIIPCLSPPTPSTNGPADLSSSIALQSLLLRRSFADWWVVVVGQLRPMKLISNIKAQVVERRERSLISFKEIARRLLERPLYFLARERGLILFKETAQDLLEKPLYSLGLSTHIPITPSSSLFLSTEAHGDRKQRRHKLILYHQASLSLICCPYLAITSTFYHSTSCNYGLRSHVNFANSLQLPYHDITLEAAWPELFIDSNGRYWNVSESVSLDLLSSISESGLRYRFGLHKNGGRPQAVINSIDGEAPAALLPGLWAKAAFSYEKSKDLWRQKETEDDLFIKTDQGKFWRPAYDVRLREPHASISTVIGGTFGAWFQGEDNTLRGASTEGDSGISSGSRKRSPVFVDLFGSVCYTFQHGKFRKLYGDLTRVDTRLDICSASAIAKSMLSMFSNSSNAWRHNPASLPRLSLIFQQQVAGPIVFRVDSKFAAGKYILRMEDFMCSLSYSLRLLKSGKVVAWYSPKRKEAMIELRLLEF
ncbi:hypothetical protein Cgig2_033247 [Carnegiea gigantea]|uniref:Protein TRIGALACTOSYLDIACYLGLYCEROL 4, chloroplastic n=1 Tax=Carnegiea gigantea TaxID=171969 RepID=A0A9Q1KUZ8_9CARY|nr:hypothetical protein Cgig2_033247 [Carnegiea gigantea]